MAEMKHLNIIKFLQRVLDIYIVSDRNYELKSQLDSFRLMTTENEVLMSIFWLNLIKYYKINK